MHICMSSGNDNGNSSSNNNNKKLRLWEAGLPGFRFSPTEQELVGYYLRRAAEGRGDHFSQLIVTVDLYKHDPWGLPELAPMGDTAWLFLVPRDRKYPNGSRPNRVTKSGYWKATGTDRQVMNYEGNSSSSQCIGLKKTLVFYQGKAPYGTKTPWIMNEYRLNDWEYQNFQTDVTLCRVHLKGLPRTYFPADTGTTPTCLSLTLTSSPAECSPPMTSKVEEEPSASVNAVQAAVTQTSHAQQQYESVASNVMLYGFDEFVAFEEQHHPQQEDPRSRNMVNADVNNLVNNNNGPSSLDHILLARLIDEIN